MWPKVLQQEYHDHPKGGKPASSIWKHIGVSGYTYRNELGIRHSCVLWFKFEMSPSHWCFECLFSSLWSFRRQSLKLAAVIIHGYVPVYVHACVHRFEGTSVQPRRWHRCLPQELATLCFGEWISLWTQNLPFFARPAGIIGSRCYACFCMRVGGVGTQVLRPVWWALYPLSYLPGPGATLFGLGFGYIGEKTIVFLSSWMK